MFFWTQKQDTILNIIATYISALLTLLILNILKQTYTLYDIAFYFSSVLISIAAINNSGFVTDKTTIKQYKRSDICIEYYITIFIINNWIVGVLPIILLIWVIYLKIFMSKYILINFIIYYQTFFINFLITTRYNSLLLLYILTLSSTFLYFVNFIHFSIIVLYYIIIVLVLATSLIISITIKIQ